MSTGSVSLSKQSTQNLLKMVSSYADVIYEPLYPGVKGGCYSRVCSAASCIIRIIKIVLKVLLYIVLFPLGVLWILGKCCQYAVLPISSKFFFNQVMGSLSPSKSKLLTQNIRILWKSGVRHCYRIPIAVASDCVIDTVVMSFVEDRREAFDEKCARPWVLVALGNSEAIEGGCREEILYLAERLKANVMMFNYPGVGKSTGTPTMAKLAQAHSACLEFLERYRPSHIYCYGFSLGTVVQGRSLSEHPMRKDVKYIAIKDRGPASMGEAADSLARVIPMAKRILTFFNWEVNLANLVKNSKIPEIIICPVDGYGEAASDHLFDVDVSLGARCLSENYESTGHVRVVKEPHVSHAAPLSYMCMDEVFDAIHGFFGTVLSPQEAEGFSQGSQGAESSSQEAEGFSQGSQGAESSSQEAEGFSQGSQGVESSSQEAEGFSQGSQGAESSSQEAEGFSQGSQGAESSSQEAEGFSQGSQGVESSSQEAEGFSQGSQGVESSSQEAEGFSQGSQGAESSSQEAEGFSQGSQGAEGSS
ncbi:CPn0927/CPn0928 family alpha/beta hydrolase fold protein [Chlamydiifrater volucris]|uniref:CPn0927/CPn0928 family alpha/beta hydrolase fold protein n=1 Tax=Chlamydiifrater volucris TaxID=2681470 RepID=UPI001BCCA633|nr:CPn0927/CPn0928 family alpha/beta hydrolase fold protein [Chlamydiifrater volucris]